MHFRKALRFENSPLRRCVVHEISDVNKDRTCKDKDKDKDKDQAYKDQDKDKD